MKIDLLVIGSLDSPGLLNIYTEAAARKLSVRAVHPSTLQLIHKSGTLGINHEGEQLLPAVVVHAMSTDVHQSLLVLDVLEQSGAKVMNSAAATLTSADKADEGALYVAAGLPWPNGGVAWREHEIHAFAHENGFPFIAKPRDSARGAGTATIENRAGIAEAVALLGRYKSVLLQERMLFPGAPNGRAMDRRAVMVDQRIISVIERTGADGETAANVFGDHEQLISVATLTPAEHDILPRAAGVVGLDICSMDYWLAARSGVVLNESNSFPAVRRDELVVFSEAVVDAVETRLEVTRTVEATAAGPLTAQGRGPTTLT